MSLLKPAENQSAYLKAGVLGFAGSGKTFTASLLAQGLAVIEEKAGRPKRPVAFFDTETGSDYVIGSFREAGLEMVVAKTRAFADLITVVNEAEKDCSVLIIDSISHVWAELVESYMRKKNKDRLAVWDWNPIKTEWRQFTDAYLCSKIHIILCGRAANTYDEWMNERGEKEIIKTGSKMRVESDFGYEPSLLFEMERVQPEKDPKKKRGSLWMHRATILKDRTDLMNGKVIDNPKFEDFLPIISSLNLGGKHFVVDPTRNSDSLIHSPDYSYEDRKKAQKIAAEEIEGELISAFPGTTKEEKKIKADILDAVFESRSWTKISDLRAERLQNGLYDIKYLLEQIKATDELPPGDVVPWLRRLLTSRPTTVMDDAPAVDQSDDIPDFLPLSESVRQSEAAVAEKSAK